MSSSSQRLGRPSASSAAARPRVPPPTWGPLPSAPRGGGGGAAVRATTRNKVCGWGLKAVMLGAASIRAGDAEVIVAGGMENMNLGPYLLPGARSGYRLGNQEVVDATVHDGLWCAICDVHMGAHAERVAAKHDVTR